jgi:hypothetical protein
MRIEHRFRAVDVGATLEPEERADRGQAVGAERLERELNEAGIVKAVVAPGPRERGYLAANNAVARLSVERPFIAFARIGGSRHPTGGLRNFRARPKEWHVTPEDVERYAYNARFHGFLMDPAHDGLPDEEVLAMLANVGLPVRVRAGHGFPPARVAATLLEWGFPTVLASFGGYPLDRGMMREAAALLDRHDDLYLDTSAVRFRDRLEETIHEHPDRVLFGSSTPDVHPSVAVMELLTLSLSEDHLVRVLDKNPSRVVGALSARSDG